MEEGKDKGQVGPSKYVLIFQIHEKHVFKCPCNTSRLSQVNSRMPPQ